MIDPQARRYLEQKSEHELLLLLRDSQDKGVQDDAFDVINERLEKRLFLFARSWGFAPADADDAVQDTFTHIWARIQTYGRGRGRAGGIAWINQIHFNILRDLKDKARTRAGQTIVIPEEILERWSTETADESTSEEEAVNDQVRFDKIMQAFTDAWNAIKPEDQQILIEQSKLSGRRRKTFQAAAARFKEHFHYDFREEADYLHDESA